MVRPLAKKAEERQVPNRANPWGSDLLGDTAAPHMYPVLLTAKRC